MAKPRLRPGGKWELALRHPDLPCGRRYFSFDSEAEALAYADQWRAMKQAHLPVPAELLEVKASALPALGVVIRSYANSGLAAPSASSPLGSLMTEVGAAPMERVDYTWLAAYVQQLKTGKKNLSPSSVRHRVQALGRAIDEWLRHNPKVAFTNPVKLLPRGYSTYSDVDERLAVAKGGEAKQDVQRDRRLHHGEEASIVQALSGHVTEGRQRALELRGGNALLTMFLVIVNSGLRLREAYTLKAGQIDMSAKVMRVQSTKQWRGKVAFRDVPMRQEVHAALTAYLSTRPGMLPGAWLFPFMAEEPGMTLKKCTQRLSGRFRIAFEYAGIEGLVEHDLRHEATCRWLELRDASGNWMFRPEELNRIMGWRPGSTMAMRYASFRGSDLAQRLWVTPEPAGKAGRGGVGA